jgi:plastocyanin
MLSFVFDNREAGVPHNVVIQELEGDVDDPSGVGEEFLASELINGVEQDYYEDDALTWEDLPEQWYFFCAVHPNMNGVGQVVTDG